MKKKVLFNYWLSVALVIAALVASQSAHAGTTITHASAWCENCQSSVDLTGKVKVTITPGHQTVKIGGTGAIGEIGSKTAKYTVIAECEKKMEPPFCCNNAEGIDFVLQSWSITAADTLPIPLGTTPPSSAPSIAIGSGEDVSAQGSDVDKCKWEPMIYSPVKRISRENGKYMITVEKDAISKTINMDDPTSNFTPVTPPPVNP